MIIQGIIASQKTSTNNTPTLDVTSINHAQSFRLLNPDYTGNCCSVDNGISILEIGFLNNYVDTTTLQAHINAGTKSDLINLYDQFGSSPLTTNNNHAYWDTAGNAQVVIINNEAHIFVDTTGNNLTVFGLNNTTDSFLGVYDIGSDDRVIFLQNALSGGGEFLLNHESSGYATTGGLDYVNGVSKSINQELFDATFNQGLKSVGKKNVAALQTYNDWKIGRYYYSSYHADNLTIKELIWFDNVNDDFDALTQDQQTYYNLT